MFCLYFLPGPEQEMFIKLFILHIFVSNTVPNVDPEIKISNFYFAFLIDKIDNIITYSPYSSYYVNRTLANGSAVFWSRDFRHKINAKNKLLKAILYFLDR